MTLLSRLLGVGFLGAGLLLAAPSFAEGDHEPAVEQHSGEMAKSEGREAHGEHGEEHALTFDDVNWMYGFLGEKDGVEPSVLWRPKGMPVPFGALALNAAILYWLLIKFGKKPISEGLKSRKLGIMKGMEDAAKVKAEAEASLAKYQKQLDEIDSEVARIKREMKEAGEAESARILSEAKERRTRMERDAHILVEQEMKAAREALMRDTVLAAVKSAEAKLIAKVGDADQQRLADEFLVSVKASSSALR